MFFPSTATSFSSLLSFFVLFLSVTSATHAPASPCFQVLNDVLEKTEVYAQSERPASSYSLFSRAVQYALSAGVNNRALSEGSASLGIGSSSSARGAFASGVFANAAAEGASSLGGGTDATGVLSAALGTYTRASGV